MDFKKDQIIALAVDLAYLCRSKEIYDAGGVVLGGVEAEIKGKAAKGRKAFRRDPRAIYTSECTPVSSPQ